MPKIQAQSLKLKAKRNREPTPNIVQSSPREAILYFGFPPEIQNENKKTKTRVTRAIRAKKNQRQITQITRILHQTPNIVQSSPREAILYFGFPPEIQNENNKPKIRVIRVIRAKKINVETMPVIHYARCDARSL